MGRSRRSIAGGSGRAGGRGRGRQDEGQRRWLATVAGAAATRRARRGWLGGLVLLVLLAVGVSVASAGEPPALASLSISPSTVNTKSSSQTVKVTAEITSVSGFAGGSVAFESPTGGQTTGRVPFTKVSGTATKGVWEATVPFKQYIQPGTWKVTSVNMTDKEGDMTRLSSTQLEAKGFAHTVLVESTEDNEPPVLAGLSIAPASVDTSSGNQTVTITAHITDNLSGFASGWVAFRSPNGKQSTGKFTFTKVSGSETDGMYEAKVTFDQYIAPGTWKINNILLVDNVGNEVLLGTNRLEARGFPDTVLVESIEDEEPPVLAGLSLSPSSVDTSSTSQTVTVSAHVTDDLAAFESGYISFESPNGKQATANAAFTKVSGTGTDGMYEAKVTFEQFIQSGTWKVKAVHLVNAVGDGTDLTAAQLEAKGFPATVHVASVEDTEPPKLAGLSLAPSSVDTTSSSQVVTVSAEITDNLSGFAHGSIVFESPNGKTVTGVASFAKVSGSATSGSYEAKVTFKQFIQSGTWKVSNVNLVDDVGNEVNLSAAQLTGKGFPTTVAVTSSEDLEPPALAGLSFAPTSVDTGTENQTVTVTAHITDNFSGFASGYIQFESQTGKQFTGKAGFTNKVSGTETDGVYEAIVTFKQSAQSGTWKVNDLNLLDNAGNEANLTGAQLEAKGLPATVQDETGAPPTIKKVKPHKGPSAGGISVTISGTNFTGATAVKFGATEAVGFTVTSVNQIVATAPGGTTGTVDVSVTTAHGTSALSRKDHFQYEAPTVTAVSPDNGSQAGGTSVTITGTGFERGSGTVIKFGRVVASNVHCGSRTSCTADSPAASRAGSVDVTAAVGSKHSAKTGLDRFTYT
jgi:hypothetical protein